MSLRWRLVVVTLGMAGGVWTGLDHTSGYDGENGPLPGRRHHADASSAHRWRHRQKIRLRHTLALAAAAVTGTAGMTGAPGPACTHLFLPGPPAGCRSPASPTSFDTCQGALGVHLCRLGDHRDPVRRRPRRSRHTRRWSAPRGRGRADQGLRSRRRYLASTARHRQSGRCSSRGRAGPRRRRECSGPVAGRRRSRRRCCDRCRGRAGRHRRIDPAHRSRGTPDGLPRPRR